MYGNLIQLLTALSAAVAAGFGVLYLGRVLLELVLAEKHENLPLRLLPEHLRQQRASGVALAAMEKLAAGEPGDAAALTPNYLRQAQAERTRQHDKDFYLKK